MIKSLFGILITLVTLTSCDNKVIANFEIINNTEFKIDSLKIEPNVSEEKIYISLKPFQKVEYQTDMTTIAKTDGAYKISYLVAGQKKTEVFGYYTNGYPLEKVTKIEIEKDTLLIYQIFEKH